MMAKEAIFSMITVDVQDEIDKLKARIDKLEGKKEFVITRSDEGNTARCRDGRIAFISSVDISAKRHGVITGIIVGKIYPSSWALNGKHFSGNCIDDLVAWWEE